MPKGKEVPGVWAVVCVSPSETSAEARFTCSKSITGAKEVPVVSLEGERERVRSGHEGRGAVVKVEEQP